MTEFDCFGKTIVQLITYLPLPTVSFTRAFKLYVKLRKPEQDGVTPLNQATC